MMYSNLCLSFRETVPLKRQVNENLTLRFSHQTDSPGPAQKNCLKTPRGAGDTGGVNCLTSEGLTQIYVLKN